MRVYRTSSLLACAFLASCSAWLTFTPERAAIQALLTPDPLMGALIERVINPDSVKVAQSQPWQDSVAVLLTFNGTEEGFGQVDCLSLYTVTKERSTWSPHREGTGCWPAGGAGEVIQMHIGQRSGTDLPGVSHLAGLVYDARVVAVEAHWGDGLVEKIEVIDGTFLQIRAGVHDPEQILPLDENGEQVQ